MTLAETLIAYKNKNQLSYSQIARKIGIYAAQVRSICIDGKTSAKTIKKLVDNLGPEFESFLEYKTCYCGKRFIPNTYNQDCCSDKCYLKYKGHSRNTSRKIQKDYAKYNERARSQGLSYGQLQCKERMTKNKELAKC